MSDGVRVQVDDLAEGHARWVEGIQISSIGLGTKAGADDEETDRRYREALLEAGTRGCNLFDTASHYRGGRSELLVGRVLRELGDGRSFAPPVVCTKGGAVVAGDGELEDVLRRAPAAEVAVEGRYSLWPGFVEASIARSLHRLGVDSIDVYYLVGLEARVRSGSHGDSLASAFSRAVEALEKARQREQIRYYGISSEGLLRGAHQEDHLSLASLLETARKVAGWDHGLRFVQAPFSITRPTAVTARNQIVGDGSHSLVRAARLLGLNFIAAESLGGGRALQEDHAWLAGILTHSGTLAQEAIQFVRSTPGVAAALVGTTRTEHAVEDLALARVSPTSRHKFDQLVPPDAPQIPWLY